MSPEELNRFEFFVRSHISRQKVKEIVAKTLLTKGAITAYANAKSVVSDEMAIIVGGITKLFAGEVMEIGK